MEDKSIYILFVLAITIHNIEEALWLPAWSKYAKRFIKQIDAQEFRFALLMVTILALLVTSAFIAFPQNEITRYIYFGFLGTIMVNVIIPHLVATVVLKRYCPGLISGLLLNLPINGFIIFHALDRNIINLFEVIVSTLIVGILLLISLPLLFRIGKIITKYNLNE
jgi:hypothetical protein